jgi:hypothetical protein
MIPESVCEEWQLLKVLVFPLLENSPQALYPHHILQMQAFTPDHHARVVYCQWLLAKSFVNTQAVMK